MMSKIILFTSFVLISQIFCGSLKKSSSYETQIKSLESQLMKDQQEFRLKALKIINETRTTRNMLRGNETFDVLVENLNELKDMLKKSRNFTRVKEINLEDIDSSDCKKLKIVITKIEFNILNCALIIESTNASQSGISQSREDVSIEYFSNFLFFDDEGISCLLRLLANVEKFLSDLNNFVLNFKSSSIQIANILYELKLTRQNECKEIIQDEAQKLLKRSILKMYKKQPTTKSNNQNKGN